MARIAILLSAFVAASAVSLSAQEISVRAGTQIPVELQTKIKTDSAKPGERVEFKTREAVLIGHDIVVPRDSKITGRIEQVLNRGTGSPNSKVRISIGHLEWKKNEASLNAVIISIEPTPAQQMLGLGRHRFGDPPTFLRHVHIRAYLLRNASTEFYSDRPDFTINKGLYFLLRQVDPENPTRMMGKDHTLDVGPRD
ncbi:MAG: hypothetical protein ROO76_07630 [Terriglobia bacterium]|nr:hypothetical protein [Terriglobia bacterium]